MNKQYLTVSTLNHYLKAKLDEDSHLQKIFIQGEISNLKYHQSGHIYFTLKDDKSRINAVMFAGYASKLNMKLQDGLKVLIVGSLSVYEAAGNFQLYVYKIELDGLGQLYLAYEQLKKKLYLEGIFDDKHKLNPPLYPKKIGVICAKPSAALEDIIKTIQTRYPIANVLVFPALVQGNKAYEDIIRKIDLAINEGVDVLIIARGGGSIEDLWNFNNEELVRKVYNTNIPIISGVGHESDITLIDYVADRRAPTPTAAAALAVPDKNEVLEGIENTINYIQTLLNHKISYNRQQIVQLENHHFFVQPQNMLNDYYQKIDTMLVKMNNCTKNMLVDYQNKYKIYYTSLRHLTIKFVDESKINLNNFQNQMKQNVLSQFNTKNLDYQNLIQQLDLVSPLNVLKRGYSLVSQDDQLVTKSTQVKVNDELTVQLKQGKLLVNVKEKYHE